MIVDCHSCGATYNISDDKVRGRRVRVRCKTCGEGIIVDGAALDDATRVYSPNFEPDATRVYAPTFEPAAYSEDKDESTRVMSASGAEWREPGPEDWTVNLSETEQRTMSLRDLVSGYNTGDVGDDAFVWRDGMTDWLPLREVPEIKAALDSGESTRVMSQAALRAAAAGSPPSVPSSPPPLTPPPPPPPPPASPGARPAPRAAAARAVMPPTPVTYAAPAAPPRALRAEPPPVASVEYAPAWPAAAAPGRGAAPARVRENRARTDLFGGGPDANSEDELLRSSSVPLEQYDEKPTGARNESSVLFSLDTLKAGARRGGATSAPPRMLAASPPTAADILGMTAGGALPGMDSTAMLLSAPRVEAPAPPLPVHAAPVKDRDTTPPTMRNKTPLGLIAAILALAVAVAGAAFFVLHSRAGSPGAAASSTAEPAPSVPAAAAPAAPPPAPTTPVATATPEPAQAPPPQAPAVEAPAPVAPGVPAAPSPPKAATPSGGSSNLEAMKAAMRPAGADKPEKPEKPADKGAKGGKVVLEEEPSGGSAPAAGGGSEAAEPPAEEAPKPPFDTGAAKTALANAAAGAAGCKKPDGPTGSGKVQVTFSPSGRATSANVIEGAFGGTPVGGCVAKLFRAAKVPAFSGDPVTVSKSFSVPE